MGWGERDHLFASIETFPSRPQSALLLLSPCSVCTQGSILMRCSMCGVVYIEPNRTTLLCKGFHQFRRVRQQIHQSVARLNQQRSINDGTTCVIALATSNMINLLSLFNRLNSLLL